MCGTCGCGETGAVKIRKPGEKVHEHEHEHMHDHGGHTHSHPHTHHHDHHEHHSDDHSHPHSHHPHEHHHASHDHSHGMEIKLEQDILQKNNLLAERNRGYFEARNILALNLVSSPGSGKTTILENTITMLKDELPLFVVEGDQQTMNDAQRIQNAGAPVVQVNTGTGCHLDSDMVYKAVRKLEPVTDSVVFIENVGNLVCPSMFDLGENFRVVIMSVTEGDDKPLKYPNMFETSDLCIINKTDLLPYVDFDVDKAKEYAMKVNHHLEFITLSARTSEGMDAWLEWLVKKQQELKA